MKFIFILMSLLYQEKVSPQFASKVIDISQKLSIQPDWLMAIIDFESAKSFSPSITNSIGCVGLIQFCPDYPGGDEKTIGGKTYYLSQLKQMTAVQQLDVVYEYYKQYKSKIVSYTDLYLATLLPSSMNKPDHYVLQAAGLSAATIARSNPAFDTAGKGYITVGDIKDTLFSKLPATYVISFRKKSDTVTKYVSRNWIGVTVTGVLLLSVVGYLIINRKSILQ